MKKYFLIIMVSVGLLVLSSCPQEIIDDPVIDDPIEEPVITACGVEDPATNFPWLAELIATAENDTTGKYLGTIWLEKYEEQDVFVVNMTLGSKIRLYHFFDCQGEPVTVKNRREFLMHLKKDIVIYRKPIVACGIADPATNIPWLAALIKRIIEDQPAGLRGEIFLVNFKGQDLFATTLNFGGNMYYTFDCAGNHLDDSLPYSCPVCWYIARYHFDMLADDHHFGFDDDDDYRALWYAINSSDIVIFSSFEFMNYE